MTNELKQIDSVTTTTAISLAATLTNGANTYTGQTGITMADLDNSSEYYPKGKAVLEIPDTFAAAPTAGSVISLWAIPLDIDGANDTLPVPAATDIENIADYMGAWVMDNQDVATRKAIVIDLEGMKKARFFIKNECGQTLSYTASPITVKITPFTVMPTA